MSLKTCIYCDKKYDTTKCCEPCPHEEMAPLFGPSKVMGEDSNSFADKLFGEFGIPIEDAEEAQEQLGKKLDETFYADKSVEELEAELAKKPKPLTLADLTGKRSPDVVTVSLVGGPFDGTELEIRGDIDTLMPRGKQVGKDRTPLYERQPDGTFTFSRYINASNPHDTLKRDDSDKIQLLPGLAHTRTEEPDDRDDDWDDEPWSDDESWRGE